MESNTHKTRVQKIMSLVGVSLVELIIGLCLVIILIIVAAVSAYLEDFALVNDLRAATTLATQNIGDFFDTPLVTNIVTLFFWGLVGLVTYSLFWALFVMFVDIRSDIVVSEYFLHPRSFHKSNFWLAALSRRVILITAYFVCALYVVLLLKSLPIVYESIRNVFVQGVSNLPSSTLSSLLAFGSWILGWHLIVLVRRFSISLTREV